MRQLMLAMGVVCLASAVHAQDAADAGDARGLHVSPHVRATTIYDSNVLLKRRDKEDDWAFWLQPGVELEWTRSKLRAGADLGIDARWYVDHSSLSETFWDASAFVEYAPTEAMTFKLSDRYVPQALVLGQPEDDTINQQQSNWLEAEGRYEHEFGARNEMELGLRGTRFDSRSFDALVDVNDDGIPEEDRVDADYWEGRGWLEGRREIGRDRELFSRFTLARRTYPHLSEVDFTEYFGTVGARLAITARIRFDFGVGWGVIDFDEQGSQNRFVGDVGLTWELPRDWLLRVSGARTLSSDVVGTDFDETSARIEVRKRLGRRTSVIVGGFWSSFDNNAVDQEQNEVLAGEVRVERELTPRIRVELGYRRWKNLGDFENDDFTQDRVTLGVAYRY